MPDAAERSEVRDMAEESALGAVLAIRGWAGSRIRTGARMQVWGPHETAGGPSSTQAEKL